MADGTGRVIGRGRDRDIGMIRHGHSQEIRKCIDRDTGKV